MCLPRPSAPLLLALLAATPARPASEERDTSDPRHLELTAENTGEEHPVRISPHHPTNLLLNAHQLEAQRQREWAERCEATLEQARTCPEGPRPGSLSDLFDAGLLGRGKSILVRDLSKSMTHRPGETLRVNEAWSYRAALRAQVAVELHVKNTGTQPWMAEGAAGTTLVSAEGVRLRVLSVWQPEPLAPGRTKRLVVVAEAMPELPRGPFLLQLGEAEGPRTLTVRGVTFP
jgi:uncharacterized protein (TIGR02268 family)